MSTKYDTTTSGTTIKTGLKETDKDAHTSPTIAKKPVAAEVKSKTHTAPPKPKEGEAANPVAASLEAIQIALSDKAIREDFLDNVADSLCSYSRRKMDEDEKQSLRNLVDNELVSRVFKVKKLAA